MDTLGFLITGLVAGWLAGTIMKGSGFGLLGNLFIGVVGAFVGGFLLSEMGLGAYGTIGAVISATVGAMVLVFVAGCINKA